MIRWTWNERWDDKMDMGGQGFESNLNHKKWMNECKDGRYVLLLLALGTRGKNVVHAKIKKHPLFLFGREPLKSYKRMKRAHCLEGGLETTQKR